MTQENTAKEQTQVKDAKPVTVAYKKPVIKSAFDLMATPLPPLEQIVDGILPVGLIVLAGKQKIGKSWLDLMLCLTVASGGYAFGTIPVKQGDTLYLALEDTDRRLQERISILLGLGETVPANFYYATQWPHMDKASGGLDALEDWIIAHPNTRLIVIDPWIKVKPYNKQRAGATGYDADYEALEGIKRLADKYNVCILIQLHVRKQKADDIMDEVNATTGVTACADGTLILKRERLDKVATLYGTGRDYREEVNLALSFNTGHWSILGNAHDYTLSEASNEVIDLLKSEARPITSKEIADMLGIPRNTIRKRLFDMKRRDEVKETEHGYILPNRIVDADTSLMISGNTSNSSNTGNRGNRYRPFRHHLCSMYYTSVTPLPRIRY